MCKFHIYKNSAWCDGCTNEIMPGCEGERCKHCSFDLCATCKDIRPLPSSQPNLTPVPNPEPLVSDEAAAQSAEVLHPLPSVYPPATSMLANPTSFFSVDVPRLPQNNPVPAGNRMKLKRATASSLLPQRPQFVFAFDGCAVPVIELWTWSM